MKKTTHSNLLIIVALTFTISSCSNLYIQQSVYVPLLKEKGDLKAEGSFGREGMNLHAAYAMGKHTSIMAGYFNAFSKSNAYRNTYNHSADIALGAHFKLGESVLYETHLGIGKGWINSSYERLTSSYYNDAFIAMIFFPYLPFFPFFGFWETENVRGKGTFNTVYWQHSLGIIATDHNEVAFTVRAQHVKVNEYQELLTSYNNPNYYYYIRVPERLFIQPVLSDKLRLFDELYLTMQLGLNLETDAPEEEVFEWNKIWWYCGLQFQINTQKKRR